MRRTRIALVLALAALGAAMLPAAPARATPAVFEVGAAVRDISPNPTVAPPDGRVWMGGFGLGAANRKSTGVDPLGIKARAMVISNGTDTLAFAINETQGMFAAYQNCACGLDDMRKAIKAQTGIPMQHIVLGSNHSHGGPDTTGVWGGVPASYLTYIKDQMVAAVVDAYNSRVPATIAVGSASNTAAQYGGDPLSIPGSPEQLFVDRTVRVLQAKRVSDATPIVTFIEAPYHPTTYCGSTCTTIHPSWPGVVAKMAADEFGGVGFAWQGDIGRQGGAGADIVYSAAKAALASATPIADSTIDGRVQLLLEEVTNPIYIYFLNAAYPAGTVTCAGGLSFGGYSLCSPVPRASTPPYGAGAVGAFWATTLRIGDVLFSGGPGEVYPNLQNTIVGSVAASQHFYLGLAQDQVGYIIGPTSSWAQVVAQRTAQVNDNGLFNAGPTLGDHLMCAHINAAASMGFATAGVPAYCPAVTASDPAGQALADAYGLS